MCVLRWLCGAPNIAPLMNCRANCAATTVTPTDISVSSAVLVLRLLKAQVCCGPLARHLVVCTKCESVGNATADLNTVVSCALPVGLSPITCVYRAINNLLEPNAVLSGVAGHASLEISHPG